MPSGDSWGAAPTKAKEARLDRDAKGRHAEGEFVRRVAYETRGAEPKEASGIGIRIVNLERLDQWGKRPGVVEPRRGQWLAMRSEAGSFVWGLMRRTYGSQGRGAPWQSEGR